MQRGMAELQSAWNAKVQPTLQSTGKLPAQFVIDMCQAIVDGVIRPVDELQNEILTANKLSQAASGILGLGTGGSSTLSLAAAAVIKARTQQAASTVEFIFSRLLTPLVNEAKLAIARDGVKAQISLATSGSDRLDQVAVTSLAASINAMRELQQIQEIAQSSFLFRIGQFGVSCVKALISVVSALATAIATIGAGFYSLFRTLYMVAKIALVGGGAYLGLKLYQQYRKPGPSSSTAIAPTSNPARRRRRSTKRGARARYYLR